MTSTTAATRRPREEVVAAAGGRALAIQASMSDPADVDRLADEALAAFGVVDILVANAGIASRGHTVADTDPAEVASVMATHTFSTHRLVQRLLPGMRERARADVVVISSSELNKMKANGAPYNMAKAALEALALTLANEEVANGVHVNIVAPGLVVTDMGAKLVKAEARASTTWRHSTPRSRSGGSCSPRTSPRSCASCARRRRWSPASGSWSTAASNASPGRMHRRRASGR